MNENGINIFDRKAVRRNRDRVARDFGSFSFLFREMAERLVDRLFDIRREFQSGLILGSGNGIVNEILLGRSNIKTLVQCDLSENMVRGASGLRLVGDEELQPFASASFDLVISSSYFCLNCIQ